MAQGPEGWEDEAPEPTPKLILEHILDIAVTAATARGEMTITVAGGGYGIDTHDLD